MLVDRNVYGQRLREMFQQRVNLFRDAVYQLTGYMATLKTEREVRPTHWGGQAHVQMVEEPL